MGALTTFNCIGAGRPRKKADQYQEFGVEYPKLTTSPTVLICTQRGATKKAADFHLRIQRKKLKTVAERVR